MRNAFGLIVLGTLGACGQSGDGNGTTGAAGGGTGPLAGGVMLQPGQWETTMQVEAANLPNLPPGVTPPTMQPITTNICITPEQAANPAADAMAGNAQQQAGCRTENFSFANGRIQGTSMCDRDGVRARSTISGQYTPTSYEMTMQTETEARGTSQSSTMRITARRIGDCPAR